MHKAKRIWKWLPNLGLKQNLKKCLKKICKGKVTWNCKVLLLRIGDLCQNKKAAYQSLIELLHEM